MLTEHESYAAISYLQSIELQFPDSFTPGSDKRIKERLCGQSPAINPL